MSHSVLLDQVKLAYDAMNKAQDRQKANEWLTAFERSAEAWGIARSLLRESPPYRFFGAIIFYNKIRQDVDQIKGDSGNPLQQLKLELVHFLVQFSSETDIDKSVCQRICLCIAALALQLNQDGVVLEILASLNSIISSAPLIVLELLTVLPEECFDRRVFVHPETRKMFAAQLALSVPDVFGFLSSLLSSPSMTNTTINQIFRCLGRWIDNVDIKANFLASQQIFQSVLNALHNNNLFDNAVDVLVSTLRRYAGSWDNNLPALILPCVLSLRKLWTDQDIEHNKHDEDVCRGLCRLFTETAEAYAELLLSDQNANQNELYEQLLVCVAYPWDFEIARIPLNCFYDINVTIQSTDGNFNYDIYGRFVPIFAQLLRISINRMKVEPDVLADMKLLDDDKDRERLDLMETVTDCCGILGGTYVLQLVCSLIQSELQQVTQVQAADPNANQLQHWCLVESCLASIQRIAPFLPQSESVVLPQLMALLPTLPPIHGLVVAVIDLSGRLALWLNQNGTYLQPVFQQLTGHLYAESTCKAAARAIRYLCEDCIEPNAVGVLTTDIHKHLLNLRSSGTFPLEADLDLLEGLCKALSMLPLSGCRDALPFVIDPIATALAGNLSQRPVPLKTVLENLDRITIILRYTIPKEEYRQNQTLVGGVTSSSNSSALSASGETGNHTQRHPVALAFERIWPQLQQILESNTSDHVTEKVCRCYKYVIRNLGVSFRDLLERMADHLVQGFARGHNAAFLYAGANCFSVFGQNSPDASQCNEILYRMLWSFSASFFAKFQSITDFEQRPDVVEEYFYLLAKTLECCPGPLVASPQAVMLVQAGITGLQLKHREAQKGILLFFERLVALPNIGQSDQQFQNSIFVVIERVAPDLVSALFMCLSGQIPAYALDENQGSISDVLWTLKQLTPGGLKGCVVQALSKLPSNCQEEGAKLSLSELLTQSQTRRDFSDLLETFEQLCRRRSIK